jgi:uncharacterized membrane protein
MLLSKKELVAITTLLVLDLVWLNLYMGPRYQTMIKEIQGEKMIVNTMSAFSAYLLMIVALVVFVIRKNFTLVEAFLFGVCLYGVYDFTCGAVFKKWDFNLAIVDIIWGGVVYMTSVYVANQF